MKTPEAIEVGIDGLLATAASSYGMSALEPQLAELLELIEANASSRPANAQRLMELMRGDDEYLRLGRPGIMELLEYTMHKLRWNEIQCALDAIDVPGSDLRERHAAVRIKSAFRDDWPNCDIYYSYRPSD